MSTDSLSKRVAMMQACAEGTVRTQIRSVQNVADVLADQMAFIHGGRWKAVCDHEVGMILVRPINEGPIPRPQPGALA